MKNLPENDFWNAVRERLQNYTEEPRDDWDKIAGALPVNRSTGSDGFTIASDYLAVILLLALLLIAGGDKITGQALSSELAGVNSKATAEKQIDGNGSIPKNTISPMSERMDSMQADGANEVQRESLRSKNIAGKRLHLAKLELAKDAAVSTDEFQRDPGNTSHIETADRSKKEITVGHDSVISTPKNQTDTTAYVAPPDKKKPKKKIRPAMYLLLTPSMGYQKITPLKNDNVEVVGLNSPGIISASRFGYQLEAGLQKLLTPNLELYAGVCFFRQQQTLSYSYASEDAAVAEMGETDWSFEIAPGTATKQFRYDMRNAGVSLGLLYHLHGKLLMHKIGGGVQYMQGLQRSGPEGTYHNGDSRYLHYQLLYRLEYNVNRSWSVFLQPTFTHTIFSREQLAEPFTIKPYRAGLGIGMFYRF